MSDTTAVQVEDLRKRFGEVRALDGIDLTVPKGTVIGLLGPNGAGKTTLVRVLATLLDADSGRASVLGFDVATQPFSVRRRIGLAGQFAAVDELQTGHENLVMVGRLYGLSRGDARARATEVLRRFDLADVADQRAGTYSGGMRRRLDLAATLVGRPSVIFLDEPSTGLDPRSRSGLWEQVAELRSEGTTILLTTQYLEEADELADRIAVIDHGRIVAEGTTEELKGRVGGQPIVVRVADDSRLQAARDALAPLSQDGPPELAPHGVVSLPVFDPATAADALRALDARDVRIAGLELRRPTLDDVFLTLTGKEAGN